MQILRFKTFESVNSKSNTYSADQFGQFCEDVTKWCDENKTTCQWAFYEGRNSVGEKFWNLYMKGGKQFTTYVLDGKLIGVLHTGDKIEMAFDNTNKPVDKWKIDLSMMK